MPSAEAIAAPRAVRAGLAGSVLGLAMLAWIITGVRMRGMDAGPGTDLGGLGWFAGVWLVMMAAMMFPSILPLVVTHARIRTGAPAVPLATALLIGGYLLTWTAAGVVAFAAFAAVRSAGIGFAWDDGGRAVAAGVLLGAALFELTPLKAACLSACRDPRTSLLRSWRPGAAGAVRMGIAQGVRCVGGCWALMAALFALGVMSVGWMALVAAMIAAEKLLPWRAVATRAVMAVLIALAVGVAIAPGAVPGLTLPA